MADNEQYKHSLQQWLLMVHPRTCVRNALVSCGKLVCNASKSILLPHNPRVKFFTVLHISCKMCCKPRIVQVSCTSYFARSKFCTFLALVILQDEDLASFLHQISYKMKILQVSCTIHYVNENFASFLHHSLYKWKSCKFLIQTFVLKFLQDTTTHTCVYTILDSFYFARFNILQHLHFGLIQGFTNILIQY